MTLPRQGKRPPPGRKFKAGAPLPFSNIVTREMAERHAVNVKVRMDRLAAERVANYRSEYDAIAGRAHRGGANAQQATADARRHFAAMHGAEHLPR
jgi:hypothetical protein